MTTPQTQSLQAFFDSPGAKRAKYNLSASAGEPLTYDELFAFEPDAKSLIYNASLDYPARHGSLSLRRAVAQRYGSDFDEHSVLITSGLDDALGMLFLSLVEPGDEIVVLTPCYPPHVALPKWRGVKVLAWPSRAELNWRPSLEELEGLLSDRTKLVLATFPQNPTGFMPDRQYTDELLRILRLRETTLVADEIYAGLPADAPRVGSNLASQYERGISLHGFSKVFGLPGLRLGWIASQDATSLSKIQEVRNLFNAYQPSGTEGLAETALRHEQAIVARQSAIIAQNNKLAAQFFQRHGDRFEWSPPDAGVLSFPRWLGTNGSKNLSDRLLRDKATIFAPSSCFDAGDSHLRLSVSRRSFAGALSQLDEFLQSP